MAGKLCDRLRGLGATYADILARVQAVRPNVTAAAEWDALLCESEDQGE